MEASGYACGSPEFPSAAKRPGHCGPSPVWLLLAHLLPAHSSLAFSTRSPSSSRKTKVPLLLLNLCATPEIREPLLQTTRGREAYTSQRCPRPRPFCPLCLGWQSLWLAHVTGPGLTEAPGSPGWFGHPGFLSRPQRRARPSWAEKETLRRSHSPWQVRQQKKPKVTQRRGHIGGHSTGRPSVGLLTWPQT